VTDSSCGCRNCARCTRALLLPTTPTRQMPTRTRRLSSGIGRPSTNGFKRSQSELPHVPLRKIALRNHVPLRKVRASMADHLLARVLSEAMAKKQIWRLVLKADMEIGTNKAGMEISTNKAGTEFGTNKADMEIGTTARRGFCLALSEAIAKNVGTGMLCLGSQRFFPRTKPPFLTVFSCFPLSVATSCRWWSQTGRPPLRKLWNRCRITSPTCTSRRQPHRRHEHE
jgi:hypothetical protein